MKRKKTAVLAAVLAAALMALFSTTTCMAKGKKEDEKDDVTQSLNQFDFSQIDKTYQELAPFGEEKSFRELVQEILTDDYSTKGIADTVIKLLFGVVQRNRNAVFQIIVLSVLSALIKSFLPDIDSSKVTDLAQMIIKISLVTILTASFVSACNICVHTLENCIVLYKAVIPVFFTVVVVASGSVTAAAYYEVILMMITFVSSVFKNVFVNFIKIYMLLGIADLVMGKEQFSKMCELLHGIVRWGCKLAAAVFTGIGGIKGIIAPVSDAYKRNLLYKSLKLVPVVGGSVEAVSQTVFGAGTIIKNGIGAAAIVALVAVCLVPVVQLTALTVLFKVTAAVIEPVTDRGFVRVVNTTSMAMGLLTLLTLMTLTLFVLMIAVVCVSTNYS